MDQGKHRPTVSAKPRFEPSPKVERGFRHELTHGNSAGNEIPKRHERAHCLNLKFAELRFEFMAVTLKNDPRQRTVGAGERTRPGKRPIFCIWLKRFIVQT